MLDALLENNLAPAFARRESILALQKSNALRVFHGAGEVVCGETKFRTLLQQLSIDRFGGHAWLTFWDAEKGDGGRSLFAEKLQQPLIVFLQKYFASAVLQYRPRKGVIGDPVVLFGTPPAERFVVHEGAAQFSVQLQGVKHPGLFLDHAPLRQWLLHNSKNLCVLNTFAYTGSLSVAAALGGASHVTTLDLSKATTRWAQENGELNGLRDERARWIAGDVFEWLPRLKREIAQGKQPAYDMVIADPPSFSRSDKAYFRQQKINCAACLLLDVLAPNGLLITSINSAQISWTQYEKDLLQAAQQKGCRLQVLQRLEQPASFPNWLDEQASERYLKGFILRVVPN
ncbi:MAG: class I SAM-dependent methyltransferase [Pseudomonadales bacterium]